MNRKQMKSRFSPGEATDETETLVFPCSHNQSPASTDGSVKIRSSCLVERVVSVFKSFGGVKKSLVRSIGFDGLLKFPCHKSLDDQLYLWLLKNLDTETMTLKTPSGEALPFKDVDVHLLCGIPFGGDQVKDDNQVTEGSKDWPKYNNEVVSIVRNLLFNKSTTASFTVEYLEELLMKDYGDVMTKEEKVAFKIAVVLYSIGCFLAVYKSRFSFPMWLLANFTEPEKIGKLNWSGYVLSVIQLAAKHIQSKDIDEARSVKLYGCPLVLQVFYLDNLELGASKTLHMDLPRISVFNEEYMTRMIESDRRGTTRGAFIEYGQHKIRNSSEVCYTRGWDMRLLKEWESHGSNFLKTTEEIHRVLQTTKNIAPEVVKAISQIGADCAMAMKLNFNTLYPDYIPTAEPCEPSTKRKLDYGCHFMLPGTIVNNAIKKIENKKKNPATDTMSEQFAKKEIASHSNFDESPFELWFHHPGILRPKRMRMYDWIKEGRGTIDQLARVWFQHNVPSPINITGFEIKTCFIVNGNFTIKVCDAIMRLFGQLDDWMYELNNDNCDTEKHWRWRHYLPASFAKAVLSGQNYLKSVSLRAEFIGDHIKYNIADCSMFVIPVMYAGKWSCYFWDFQMKTISVLDPLMMRSNPHKVEYQHGDYVDKLHDALFACIDQFFSGWHVDKENWTRKYPTHLGPRCWKANSGLNVTHYARAFDGDELNWNLKETNEAGLIEPRSELLYFVLTMNGNHGYIPEELLEDYDRYSKHRRCT